VPAGFGADGCAGFGADVCVGFAVGLGVATAGGGAVCRFSSAASAITSMATYFFCFGG
jgi:hypothetical protein